MSNPGDTAATWNLKLNDGPHTVTFEHGTTSGKRVITVDGREVYMKLVLEMIFVLGYYFKRLKLDT